MLDNHYDNDFDHQCPILLHRLHWLEHAARKTVLLWEIFVPSNENGSLNCVYPDVSYWTILLQARVPAAENIPQLPYPHLLDLAMQLAKKREREKTNFIILVLYSVKGIFQLNTLCPSSTRVSVESSIVFRTGPLMFRFFHAKLSTMLSVKAVCCGVAYPLLQGLLLLNNAFKIRRGSKRVKENCKHFTWYSD